MRKILVAGLAAQLALSPALAADLIDNRDMTAQQTGAFVGARMRVALGGEEDGRLRAGLVAAPTLHSRASDGRISTRFGEGLEIGVRQDRPLTVSLAGQPLSGPDARRPQAGVSTLGWIAIGTAVVLTVGVVLFVHAMNESSE